jgi:hypothetical protein
VLTTHLEAQHIKRKMSENWYSLGKLFVDYWEARAGSRGDVAAPTILRELFSARNTTMARFSFFHPGSMAT